MKPISAASRIKCTLSPRHHHQAATSRPSPPASLLNHNIHHPSPPHPVPILALLDIAMSRKPPKSPSSPTKSSATKSTRDQSPVVASTPATAVPSSSPSRRRPQQPTKEESPAEGIVTQEMLREESELRRQQDHADSSSQVLPPSSTPRPTTPVFLRIAWLTCTAECGLYGCRWWGQTPALTHVN